MKVVITNLYTDRKHLYEGSDASIEHQLLIDFPWLRTPNSDHRGQLMDTLEHLEGGQGHLVEIEHPPMTKSESGNLKSAASSQIARTMLGFTPQLMESYRAVSFLAGGREVPFETVRRAMLNNEEDPDCAALAAFGFEVSSENRIAVHATKAMLLEKAEPPPEPKFNEVVAASPDGEDVAAEVRAALADNFAMWLDMAGKHSEGTFVACDAKSNQTWLLKPGSGKQGAIAGSDEDPSSQAAREAAFYHVGKLWGLFAHLPRAELLFLDGKPYAAMELLGGTYQTLEHRRKTEPNVARTLLRGMLQDGTVHQLAVLDYVAGNGDSHGQNIMANHEGEIKLIDHGSAFAGKDFDPPRDQNSFVPYYLRAWWSPANFKDLSPEQKLESLPHVSGQVRQQLAHWLVGLDDVSLGHLLSAYGIDPEPTLARLGRLKHMVNSDGLPVDQAIGRLWTLG